MKIVIFGLTVSSSWGNGHATLWRGLCGALSRRGHQVVFFERDVPYYAAHRDLWTLPGGVLRLYGEWDAIRAEASRHLKDADVALVTSFCPDAIAASELVLESKTPVRAFYDLDSPVTLQAIHSGHEVSYIGPNGLDGFDVVLSYAGGKALEDLQTLLGAKRVAPLYGSVDPAVHRPVAPVEAFSASVSYLGTHAPDRQQALNSLFIEPARLLPERKFLIGGAQYDGAFPWLPNVLFMNHVYCADHPAFFCSSQFTLNVTRRAMADNGYCPSGRLFEAAACGAAMLSDTWEGLDLFFEPGAEILVAQSTSDVILALDRSPEDIRKIGAAARARALSCHTADIRAREMEEILGAAMTTEATA